MGQRHQIFLIARVRPHGDADTKPNYRCVAALHHQWCYGTLPLKAARRFISLVSQKDNAKIAAAELDAIQGKYGSCGDEDPLIPDIPCPYLLYLLTTSWCVDLDAEEPYFSGTFFTNDVLSASMESGGGDNNDGITIIDVTYPSKPAYCFNMIGERPLSAEQYVRGYYPNDSPRKEVERAIDSLADVPMITYEMLAEAWPDEYRPSKAAREAEKLADGHEQAAAIDHLEIPSFADMALEKAIFFALESGDTAEVEEQEMLWMPDKVLAIKTILRSNAMSDAAIRLLKKVILAEQETNVVDISGFSLSPEQVMQLIPALSHDLQSINLSNNPSLTIDAVRCILTAAPKLQKLWLLGCPITSGEVYHLVESSPALLYHMEALIHPAFLQPLVDDMDYCPYKPAFTFFGLDQFPRTAALPYFTPTRIVRALTVFLRPMIPSKSNRMAMMSSPLSSGHVPQVAFSGICFDEGQSWRERTVANIPQYSTERVGWAFCFQRSWMSRGAKNGFGFVRWRPAPTEGPTADESRPPRTDTEEAKADGEEAQPSMPVPEVHDLASFLRCMASEGCPLPRNEDVAVLEDIIQKLQEVPEEMAFMGPLKPFEEKDIISWFNAVDQQGYLMRTLYG